MTRKRLTEIPLYTVATIDGERFAVDEHGEIDYTLNVTKAPTREQADAFKTHKSEMQSELYGEFIEGQHAEVSDSYFIFMIYEPCKKFLSDYPLMKNGDYARLVYLSTFLQRDSTRIKLNRKSYAKKTDIQNMLEIPTRTARDFVKRAIDSGIIFIDSEGYANISNELFKNGSVGRTTSTRHFAKLYIQNTRALYLAFKDKKNVAKIDTLYSLVPYLDLRYNVLCENLNENTTDILDIMPLTDERIAEILGVKDVKYLRSTLRSLFVEINGIKFSLIADLNATATNTSMYVVSPFFVYRSHNAQKWLRTETHLLFYTEYYRQAQAQGKLQETSAFLKEYEQLTTSIIVDNFASEFIA